MDAFEQKQQVLRPYADNSCFFFCQITQAQFFFKLNILFGERI